MEQILPRPELQQLVKEMIPAIHHLADALHTVNFGLYVQGFLHGFAICATVLTAIWAFSRKS